jgi:hypothetical protein
MCWWHCVHVGSPADSAIEPSARAKAVVPVWGPVVQWD